MTVDKVLDEEIYAFGSNSAADVKNAVAQGVTFIGSTALDLVEITRVFSEFGVPTKKWVYGDPAQRVYANWLRRVLKRFDVKLPSEV
ncbi:MAG: hypothetical protein WA397_02825 [Roseiarcus sp.]